VARERVTRLFTFLFQHLFEPDNIAGQMWVEHIIASVVQITYKNILPISSTCYTGCSDADASCTGMWVGEFQPSPPIDY